MILQWIQEASAAGARLERACELLGISPRLVQRWRKKPAGGEDERKGPRSRPKNRLSSEERERVLQVMNSPEYRNQSPNQIVPTLADRGVYLASESTLYRILREGDLNAHRQPSKPRERHKPSEQVATGPNQVWSWDISYLRSPVQGLFYYLYLIVDVYSRKIVGHDVRETESGEYASLLIEAACRREGIRRNQLVIHQDNGAPMKGATLKATLERLGVMTSYSRPHVCDDNPFSEALFRTVKYRPEYPSKPFESLDQAREWVECFVAWYNTEHRHSGIRFVTPCQRHEGKDVEILAHRHSVYTCAREKHPERWSGMTRNWSPIESVVLNPGKRMKTALHQDGLQKAAS